MAQSLSRILLHLVFSTKNRERWLDPGLRCDLHAYLAGGCRAIGCEAYRVGGTDDHVHVACSLPRTVAAARLLGEIKASSSAWMKTHGSEYQWFAWQTGYGAFSLGQSQLPALLAYIGNQEEHHKRWTFQEELLAFLERYEVEHDERYLWD